MISVHNLPSLGEPIVNKHPPMMRVYIKRTSTSNILLYHTLSTIVPLQLALYSFYFQLGDFSTQSQLPGESTSLLYNKVKKDKNIKSKQLIMMVSKLIYNTSSFLHPYYSWKLNVICMKHIILFRIVKWTKLIFPCNRS